MRREDRGLTLLDVLVVLALLALLVWLLRLDWQGLGRTPPRDEQPAAAAP